MRGGAILLALCLSLTAAAAQDRPPERPNDTVSAQAPEAATPRQMFGPPAPPAWWLLRGTDRDHDICLRALSDLGAAYEEQPPLIDPQDADCGIARPVRVDRILPGLVLEGGAVMRCDTARALGLWARDFLRPAALHLPDAPHVIGLQLGTTYDCRPRIGTGKDRPKLSEHALGNAIDIAAIQFDGEADPLPIRPRSDSGDLAEAYQRTIRAAGCLFFTTVLGPGTNDAHDDHLHLDIATRRGGWRLCQ